MFSIHPNELKGDVTAVACLIKITGSALKFDGLYSMIHPVNFSFIVTFLSKTTETGG